MSFKFEQLDVWQISLEYSDMIYDLADKLPERERFNLVSQITRAATSISLNIAEGSTGQSNPEQNRFLGLALRSLIETVACQRIITRRKYVIDHAYMGKIGIISKRRGNVPKVSRKTWLNRSNLRDGVPPSPNY